MFLFPSFEFFVLRVSDFEFGRSLRPLLSPWFNLLSAVTVRINHINGSYTCPEALSSGDDAVVRDFDVFPGDSVQHW